MGAYAGPDINEDGLVLALDAGNTKGYDKYENLMTNSQLGTTIFNDGGAVTLTTDTTITNPFGGSDGVLKCVHTTNTPGYFRRGQNRSLTAGVTYTFSFYFKNGTVSNPYGQNRIYIGTLTSTYTPTFQELGKSLNTNIPVGDGWYRQVFTFTPSYTQTYQVDFNQAVNQTPLGTYYLYGFQLERGSSVTDYYATTSTTKTRGTTWTDLSGNGNNGTLVNGVGYSNGALSFDGVNDYVEIGSQSLIGNGTSPFSTEIWFYNTRNWSNGQYTMIMRIKQDAEFFVTLYNPSGTLNIVSVFRGSTQWGIPVTQSDYVNRWVCVSSVYNGGNKSSASSYLTYVNGVQLPFGTNNFGAAGGTGSNCNIIGADGNSGCNTTTGFHGGSISSYKIYNKALTASEIQQNFNATRGRFGI